ncbi:MAG: hypothetical protein U5O15_07920 [Candidatus Krumholzibacteriota bacterium]|nr:hypothetical protein [Candidatus Krumholzibacteriota bacterium]
MKKDFDIEEELKNYRIDLGRNVKRSVMKRYAQKYGRRSSPSWLTAFRPRPIPVYLGALLIAAAIVASFFAGRASLPRRSSMTEPVLLEEQRTNLSREPSSDTPAERALQWEPASRDFF